MLRKILFPVVMFSYVHTQAYLKGPIFVGKDSGCDWLARTYDSDLLWGTASALIGAVTKQTSSGTVNDCISEFMPVLIRF